MEQIEWNEKYEVGNLEIDAEHRVFVKILQKIIMATESKRDSKAIERLIDELLKYTEFHFCSEENIMFDITYPEIMTHKFEHEKLLMDLRYQIFAFEQKERDLHELVDFLKNWFINHTLNTDKKMALYLRQYESD